jgi:hypothetical protein
MDNNIFRVNGEYKPDHIQLSLAVESVMRQKGYIPTNNMRVKGWSFDTTYGLILYWMESDHPDYNSFPTKLGPDEVTGIIINWLESEDADTVTLDPWCEDADHDGHNGKGFLLYVQEWGHVNQDSSAMFAVKPCYMWYGK